ncbi:hypothetical protein JZ751_024186 [Albula glossodonta]|uniref:Uncharacterized protein n=1 Tax=Albula glossodonta TaxID=121402 RepID=A0A8T2NGP6_9TELE|nr:hypothetical protein JZ751_024186 [Albula glossodonta]
MFDGGQGTGIVVLLQVSAVLFGWPEVLTLFSSEGCRVEQGCSGASVPCCGQSWRRDPFLFPETAASGEIMTDVLTVLTAFPGLMLLGKSWGAENPERSESPPATLKFLASVWLPETSIMSDQVFKGLDPSAGSYITEPCALPWNTFTLSEVAPVPQLQRSASERDGSSVSRPPFWGRSTTRDPWRGGGGHGRTLICPFNLRAPLWPVLEKALSWKGLSVSFLQGFTLSILSQSFIMTLVLNTAPVETAEPINLRLGCGNSNETRGAHSWDTRPVDTFINEGRRAVEEAGAAQIVAEHLKTLSQNTQPANGKLMTVFCGMLMNYSNDDGLTPLLTPSASGAVLSSPGVAGACFVSPLPLVSCVDVKYGFFRSTLEPAPHRISHSADTLIQRTYNTSAPRRAASSHGADLAKNFLGLERGEILFGFAGFTVVVMLRGRVETKRLFGLPR